MDKLTTTAGIIPLLISLLAVYMAFLTYRRQRTFENQNHLFKFKLEAYRDLLSFIHKQLTDYRKEVLDFYHKNSTGQLSEEDFSAKIKFLEKYADALQDEVLIKSAFFPEEVVNALDDLLDKLFEDDNFFNVEEEELNDTLKVLDETYEILLQVAEVMREDMGIDALNTQLADRIHK
jgi:hypothetical protein